MDHRHPVCLHCGIALECGDLVSQCSHNSNHVMHTLCFNKVEENERLENVKKYNNFSRRTKALLTFYSVFNVKKYNEIWSK